MASAARRAYEQGGRSEILLRRLGFGFAEGGRDSDGGKEAEEEEDVDGDGDADFPGRLGAALSEAETGTVEGDEGDRECIERGELV